MINKTIITVNAMKSDALNIDTKNNYVKLSQKIVVKGLNKIFFSTNATVIGVQVIRNKHCVIRLSDLPDHVPAK